MNVADCYKHSKGEYVIYGMDGSGNCNMIFSGTLKQCKDVAKKYKNELIIHFHK